MSEQTLLEQMLEQVLLEQKLEKITKTNIVITNII
jgi:hypothetical protein